jgi:hypothetical protein
MFSPLEELHEKDSGSPFLYELYSKKHQKRKEDKDSKSRFRKRKSLPNLSLRVPLKREKVRGNLMQKGEIDNH